jgi:hypothetical protein
MVGCELLNIFSGAGWVSKEIKQKRETFRTLENEAKLNGIVNEVMSELEANQLIQRTTLSRR